jgi:hypothetical protein
MELFRFRIVRPVLSQPSSGLDVTKIGDLNMPDPRVRVPAPLRRRRAVAQSAATQWLDALSQSLAAAGDLLSPDAVVNLLPANWLGQLSSATWSNTGQQLIDDLVTAVQQRPPLFSNVEAASRRLLVYDLVNTLGSDQPKPLGQRSVKTAADVQAVVSWRHVILPPQLFTRSPISLLARRPGVTDFYVVRDEWNHYEPAEIAAIVNVLPGESFSGIVRHSQTVDTTTATTTQLTSSQLTEQQQTTSTSLSDTSSKDASINIGVQAQVQTSGQYGPTHVDTSLGAQLQVSLSQSESHALTSSSQIVQRSVKSVTQTVTTLQSQRTVTRDQKIDKHTLENQTVATTVGIYRWLSEIHYVQLVRYPNRFILEFQIPEPGAWLRWALQHRPTDGWDNPDPGPFRLAGAAQDLSPSDITAANFTQLVQQWRVHNVPPPPSDTINLSVKLASTPPDPNQKTGTYLLSDDTLTVPDGYSAQTWAAQCVSWMQSGESITPKIFVTVGGSDQSLGLLQGPGAGAVTVIEGAPGSLVVAGGPLFVGSINSGIIPVTVLAFNNLQGLTVAVNVSCTLTSQGLQQWQQQVFDLVAAGYQDLLNAFQQERDSRNVQAGGLVDLTGPPQLNQQRIIAELRRAVVSNLLDSQLPLVNNVVTDPMTGEPSTPTGVLLDTDTVQFIEQSLEWSNIVYICYPYYWGRRTEWVRDVNSASADPDFDQFLNAGSARVVVPVRPGFENLMLFYLYTGVIWGGTQPPAPNDPNYLSIAEEIESLQRGATDGTPVGDSWRVSLPTTLIWAGTDPATLPSNPHPTIPDPPQ